jgi:O-acetyl-ADP-ribose deacetylase (regulator of RNase III)
VPGLVAVVRDALVAEGGADRLARGGLRLDALPPREQVRALLTVRDPAPLPPAVLAALERVLARERIDRGVVDAANLPRWPGRPLEAVWQGDITRLRIDAIVNAANERMLGCLRPFHRCIDNAIHMAAGPRLRDDTARIVAIQGGLEPTGRAKATRAYALPARYVLHTVGPIVHGPLTREHAALLASSYRSCLDLAAELSARSIAFCAISTGVFGYPPVEAAQVAISTVDSWLAAHPGALDLVVFDVFSDADRRIYEEALR